MARDLPPRLPPTLNRLLTTEMAGLKYEQLSQRLRRPWARRVLLLGCGLVSALAFIGGMSQVPVSSAEAAQRGVVGLGHDVNMSATEVDALLSTPAPGERVGYTPQDLIALANLAAEKTGPAQAATNNTSGAQDQQAPSDPAQPKPLETAPEAKPTEEKTLQKASEQIELIRDEQTKPAPTPAKEVKRKVMWMEVTAYCPCAKCCGEEAAGVTASGKRVTYNRGRFVAADTSVLPFGTKLSIPGYHSGQPVEVIDRGGAIKGRKLDVYFNSHSVAKQWGKRMIPVVVEK